MYLKLVKSLLQHCEQCNFYIGLDAYLGSFRVYSLLNRFLTLFTLESSSNPSSSLTGEVDLGLVLRGDLALEKKIFDIDHRKMIFT